MGGHGGDWSRWQGFHLLSDRGVIKPPQQVELVTDIYTENWSRSCDLLDHVCQHNGLVTDPFRYLRMKNFFLAGGAGDVTNPDCRVSTMVC